MAAARNLILLALLAAGGHGAENARKQEAGDQWSPHYKGYHSPTVPINDHLDRMNHPRGAAFARKRAAAILMEEERKTQGKMGTKFAMKNHKGRYGHGKERQERDEEREKKEAAKKLEDAAKEQRLARVKAMVQENARLTRERAAAQSQLTAEQRQKQHLEDNYSAKLLQRESKKRRSKKGAAFLQRQNWKDWQKQHEQKFRQQLPQQQQKK
eukprot:TRINITY_DN229_c1_g3_i1.p1 TRINITY_DN229_c1_g3~~TRINITY_DN229_c1_g3_i1.p1  ORF type:complete len:212 (+),score=76.24 TRINITY_DN229_c1_g3_i1:81-716(+)